MTSYSHDNEKLARDYDRLGEIQFHFGQRLVERMALDRTARVLDVGCGTGRLAQWLSGRSELEGNVVGVDPLPDRIALARERAPGLRFEIGYAEDLAMFPDQSFDAVCLMSVFHWIADKTKALAEIARVLCADGRFGLTTTPKELHAASPLAAVFASMFSRPPYRGRIRIQDFALGKQSCTVTETIELLRTAGLALVELHVIERHHTKVSAAEMLDFIEASSFGNFLSAIPTDLHDTLRTDLRQALEAQSGGDGLAYRDYGMMVVARKLGGCALKHSGFRAERHSDDAADDERSASKPEGTNRLSQKPGR